MLFRSTGQRGIAGRQKLQLVQIGASQTERTLFFFEGNPSLPPKTFLTLVTLRVAVGDEDFDFFFFWLWCGSHNAVRASIRYFIDAPFIDAPFIDVYHLWR